mmetsp:Transcript_51646/g.102642  ORF Transcript_51646/g.102642 Transcript_51646/m.102642 type:complete len:194 (-) Transcript_51646:87-668(-)
MASTVTEAPTEVGTEQCLLSTSLQSRLEEVPRACESDQCTPSVELEQVDMAAVVSEIQDETALLAEPSTVTEPPVGLATECPDIVPVQHPLLGPVAIVTTPGKLVSDPVVNYVQVGEPKQVGRYVSERINISPEEYARLTAGREFRNPDCAVGNNQAECVKDTAAPASSDATGVSKEDAAVVTTVRRKSKRCC